MAPDLSLLAAQVASVNDFCGQFCTYDATTAAVFQDPVTPGNPGRNVAQLPYVSWPRGQTPNPNPGRYFFDDSAGSGVPVYILDTGATTSNPVSPQHLVMTRWRLY